jgi:hypothetical protein
MTFDPAERIVIFHEAINGMDIEDMRPFFAENAVWTSDGVGSLVGRDAILAGIKQYFADYPDQKAVNHRVETLTPLSGRAVWSVRATHATSGKALVREGEETITFNEDGEVVSVDVTDYQAF